MKVLKFGGTSLGTPERMHRVAELITASNDKMIVVLSAISGTTNALVEIAETAFRNDEELVRIQIEKLFQHYIKYYQNLLKGDAGLEKAKEIIDKHFSDIRTLTSGSFSEAKEKELLAKGEILSTNLFLLYLQETKISATLISALDFMRIDEDDEPDENYIAGKLNILLEEKSDFPIILTQGYICLNAAGEIDNLKRGGSDYTASLIGAAVDSEEIQIWTDIDGMHNNDPRIVENTYPIAELSFEEAAELAYFGAKILHPSSILPAQKHQVPVRLLNTMKPEKKGTLVSHKRFSQGAKAVAAKDDIIAIKIKSSRMLMAYGFLRKVFEIFENFKTSIDMITTSEVAVSLTVDTEENLEQICVELRQFGYVEVDKNQTIICIVGDSIADQKGVVEDVFHALRDVPIRMISYGGSKNNISLLIDTGYKTDTLNRLNKGLFVD